MTESLRTEEQLTKAIALQTVLTEAACLCDHPDWPPLAASAAFPCMLIAACYYHPEWLAAAMRLLNQGESPEVQAAADRLVAGLPIAIEQEQRS